MEKGNASKYMQGGMVYVDGASNPIVQMWMDGYKSYVATLDQGEFLHWAMHPTDAAKPVMILAGDGRIVPADKLGGDDLAGIKDPATVADELEEHWARKTGNPKPHVTAVDPSDALRGALDAILAERIELPEEYYCSRRPLTEQQRVEGMARLMSEGAVRDWSPMAGG
jgi:hypothetical protein